ncbi:MAG: Type 1 glutamine amidotransferase-like domain-containing protein [Clostridiales bacterium]|nr:Type 1 glutamine amidotransferase-like domain-containing protein [Clostridiales bacterium]
MKAILTSSIGGSYKENGKRLPAPLFWYNGFLDQLKEIWVENSKVMIICSSPNDYERNDAVCQCFRQSFPMSELSISYMEICDSRNEELVNKITEMDVVLLAGGHVPTQNAFFARIGLREKLKNFDGLIISWSAGSMNCADIVYAGPELEGEAIDPDYQRWISGLGITKVNILPHFQSLKEEWLDGFRLIEDITFADSMGHEIIAMNDGAYIVIENGVEKLFGEAYRIKDGQIEMICQNGMSIVLKE